MSYMYRNKKTREVITTSNKVSGKNWEPVNEKLPQHPPVGDPPEDDSLMEEDTIEETPEEETVEEEAPVEKPKTSRRGKK